MRKYICAVLLLLIAFPISWIHAQNAPTAVTTAELNVRSAPNTNGSTLNRVPKDTTLILEARNENSTWALARTLDGGVRGWVSAGFLDPASGVSVAALPVSVERFGEAATANTTNSVSALVNIPAAASQPIDNMVARLESTPLFSNMSTGAIRRIYSRGLSLGNRKNVFTRVGDSITASQPFMWGIGGPEQNLGSYSYLQATVDFFSVPPRDGYSNSFGYNSMAAQSAFNAAAVLDDMWADPSVCLAEESPLECEYRLSKPSVAIVMLGSVDVQIYDLETYTRAMRQIVKISVDSGVIPVLTTFPMAPDHMYYEKSLQFNMVILDLARSNGIPLINLWRAARSLPDNGLGPDRYHLSQGPTYYTFTGEENLYGLTLRNLMTLQALDELRRNVLR
jgi:uncharacterized protein YraI